MTPERLKAVVAANVKGLRDKRGLTQEQLAEAIEKSPEAVSMFERGKTTPALETIALMASALGVSIRDLLTEEGLPVRDRRGDLMSQAQVALAELTDDQLETAVKVLTALRDGFRRT